MKLTKQTQISILEKYDIKNDELQEQIEEFISYWKEKSPNGRKERWQMEKTFDPNLRLHRWLKNNKKWSNRVIINSEDEETAIKLKEIERKKKLLFNKL